MHTLIHSLLAKRGSQPNAISLVRNDQQITYEQLCQSVERYAYRLQLLGVKPGQPVVLVLDNTISFVITLYALWYLGAVVVALNYQSRAHEILRIKQLTRATLVLVEDLPMHRRQFNITGGNLAESDSNSKIMLISNSMFNRWSNETGQPVIYQSSADDLAQIIFTSGTTGNPKGVQLTHDNLWHNSISIVEYLALTQDDRVYQVLPFYYSYGNSVLHTHLLAGGSVHIGHSMQYPQLVVDDLCLESITGFSGVPSTFILLLAQSKIEKQRPKLRYLTQAGGPMTLTLQKKLKNIFPDSLLFVMYGQTEASARLSYVPPDRLEEKMESAGIAIPGVELAIFDGSGNACASGVEGEVVARGPNIMKGYWNNPKATSEVIKNGWLHTSDLGYMDDEGFIFLKGRKSHMIKSGAHRIHPGEIEEVIAQIPFIVESAVIGISDPMLGEAIQVYLVAKKEELQDDIAVLKHCRQQLPLYKLPKHLVWVNQLPKTASGKIQKHLLGDSGVKK